MDASRWRLRRWNSVLFAARDFARAVRHVRCRRRMVRRHERREICILLPELVAFHPAAPHLPAQEGGAAGERASLSLSPSLPPLSLFSTHSSQPTTTRGWGPRSGPPPLPTARDQQQPLKLHSQQTQPPHALCRLPPPTVGAAITAHRQPTNPNSHNYSPTLRAHRARRAKLTTAPTTDTPAAGAYTGTSPSYSIITIKIGDA